MPGPQPFTPSLLSFVVVAALVTTAGTLFGHYLKEMILAKSFESWKQRRSLESLYNKYRDPIVLSAIELASRLDEVCNEHPAQFLASKVLSCEAPQPSHSSERDPYYFRYKCQSTIYRLSAFLGWLELYRQDLVFLDVSESKTNAVLQNLLKELREDLADGTLNSADDWSSWSDALIFREEQRAVGETMITSTNGTRTVMGYGSFVALLENPSSAANRWIQVVTNFFIDPGPSKDFRLVRYKRLVIHLVDLVRTLDRRRLPEKLADAANWYSGSLNVVRNDGQSQPGRKRI
jgi:hypothetical protein